MDPRTKRKCLTLKVNTNNPGIKTEDNAPNSGKIRKRVCWDMKSLEEQSNEMKNNKPKMKITEPKTPYHHIEEDDDEYLKQLNEINKIKPTKEVLEEVYKQLELRSHESNHEDEEADTEINEDKKKEEFLEKRKSAYKNEFTLARKFSVNCEDKEEEECRNETLKNTLFNKFSGKLHKEQDEQ